MAYERVNWEDSPSTNTPINATNLNIMDAGIKAVSDATDITTTNPSSQTSYYPTFISGTNNQRINDGLRYDTQQGTTSNVGRATLVLGNGTASGTAGNKQGRLALHNSSTGYTWLQTATSSSSFTQTLPALTGTVCVKQGANITAETNGWYKVDMGAFIMYFINSQTASTTFGANATATIGRNLPSGVSFNAAKMVFVGSARGNDNVIRATTAIADGNTSFTISWHNDYSGSVTTTIIYNATLIVFP